MSAVPDKAKAIPQRLDIHDNDKWDLAVLYKFDQVFRLRLFSHVPQKSLNGLSPVRFTLNLRMLRDGEVPL